MQTERLSRIQSSLRAASSRRRETLRLGPFLVTVTPESDNPFLNYAIPDDGAIPNGAEVERLVAAFVDRGRKPRLEYIPELAPAVEPALVAQGFAVEMRTPLMVCPAVFSIATPDGIEVVRPGSRDEVRDLASSLNEAYGGQPPSEDEVTRQHERIQAGWIALLARHSATGERIGGGFVVSPEDGVAEIAGIGVRPAFRRRGIAAAVVSKLTELACKEGTTLPFLMAASEAEARIYSRVGYQSIGAVLHISK